MESDFWHQRWSENQIGFHQEKINSRLVKLWPKIALQCGDKVFVPLCGKSKDMLWLAAQTHSVLGVELSPIACREFFEDNGIKYLISHEAKFEVFRGDTDTIELWSGDFFELSVEHLSNVAGVYDRASLIALPPSMREKYVAHLGSILKSRTKVLLIAMEYDEHKMKGPPFSVSEEEVRTLFDKDFTLEQISESSGPDIVGNLKQRGLDTLTEKIFLLERR
ncbi:MAG: thiopurine S-methyltransferase [Arenicellales bacterium]